MVEVCKESDCRIRQGDIFKNVEYVEYVNQKTRYIDVSRITFPYVIVLSQDCDLEQDFNSREQSSNEGISHDKYLISVLVAPLYNYEDVIQGLHLVELELKMRVIESDTDKKRLKQNQTPRYHYLEFSPDEDIQLVPLIVDFKHYFTVNVNYLRSIKGKNWVCAVSALFREDISLRFANYLARIGLPPVKVSS